MSTYQESAKGSNFDQRLRPSRADLRFLAAKLEHLAQDLHRGPIPSTADLIFDKEYRLGRRAGRRMNRRTSGVLAGLVHGLRRAVAHRKQTSTCLQVDNSEPLSIYPLVSSALEGGDRS